MALKLVVPGAEGGRSNGMALTSFLTEPGAPDDGMALLGSPSGLPGGNGMARPSR